MEKKYLTKSLFKTAMECPTKLYYSGKREYANSSLEDPFLEALADGGFQVGELAKCYFPGGQLVSSRNYDEALLETSKLMEQDEVVLFEAAIRFENLFARVDILVKSYDYIKLIEVKSKSFDPTSDCIINTRGDIYSGWKPYIYDVAFQKYVLESAYDEYTVTSYLWLVDRSAQCPTDGLNQKFRVVKDRRGRKTVEASKDISEEDIQESILFHLPVDEYCAMIYDEEIDDGVFNGEFIDFIQYLSNAYCSDQRIVMSISGRCSDCEFVATQEMEDRGLKDGYKECWKSELHWQEVDFEDQTVFEIWNCRKKDKLLSEGVIKINDVEIDDIAPHNDGKPGVSPSERQWLQIEKVHNRDTSFWVDYDNLEYEMSTWKYPLHFIDFETCMAAIPFNRGRHPYEGIAFQFSHHVIYEDGSIEHKGQYLNTVPGYFPNYDFVRNLMYELNNDEGSIFRYAAHENTYLNIIYHQLLQDNNDIEDRDELCQFIKSITKSSSKNEQEWIGNRNMIDMLEIVKRYYYDPLMRGSNSIKKVLPAMLNSSEYLREKYSEPIYGARNGIKSLNYSNWKWIDFDNDTVIDPYKLLPKMFDDVSNSDFELLMDDNKLKDGGAAMIAYAKMQFQEMSDYERSEVEKALLKYCELDTMAMVMIYEGWKNFIERNNNST